MKRPARRASRVTYTPGWVGLTAPENARHNMLWVKIWCQLVLTCQLMMHHPDPYALEVRSYLTDGEVKQWEGKLRGPTPEKIKFLLSRVKAMKEMGLYWPSSDWHIRNAVYGSRYASAEMSVKKDSAVLEPTNPQSVARFFSNSCKILNLAQPSCITAQWEYDVRVNDAEGHAVWMPEEHWLARLAKQQRQPQAAAPSAR